MGYYNQRPGDLPQLGAVPTRVQVVGGLPRMRDVRATMAAQGLRAEGHITRRSNFDPSKLQATRGQLVRGYAARLAYESGGDLSYGQALQQSRAAFRKLQPRNRGGAVYGGTLQQFAPPQLPMAPFIPGAANIEVLPEEVPTVGDYGEATRSIGARYGLGNTTVIYGMGDELGGFSLKKIVKKVARGVKHVASPVQRGLTHVGHEAGKIITSKVGQAALGTVLAATGVGVPAAAAIFGGTKAFGNLIKPGGNLKHAAIGAFQGAAEGATAGLLGKAARSGVAKSVGRTIEHGVVKTGKGIFHGVEAVGKGAVHGVESLGKAIIGIPGHFIPTSRDPNGDGINEDTGTMSDEAMAAEQAGRAMRGGRLPLDEKPRVGWPGQFPRSANDPTGTGIDMTTGDLTPEAAGGVQRGAAVTPDQLPPDAPPPPPYTAPYGGGGGGGGGFDAGSLAAGAGLAAGGEAGAAEAGVAGAGGLGGLLGGINPTIALAGAAAVIFLPKLLGGGKRGAPARARSTRRRSRSRSRRR